MRTLQTSLRGAASLLQFTAPLAAGDSLLLRIKVSVSHTRLLWASWAVVLQEENIGKLYSQKQISPQLNRSPGSFEVVSQIFRWNFSISQFTRPSVSWKFVSHWMGCSSQRSNFPYWLPLTVAEVIFSTKKEDNQSDFNAGFDFTIMVLYNTVKQWHPSPVMLRASFILYDLVLLDTQTFWLMGCLSAWITCLFKTFVDQFQTSEEDLENGGPWSCLGDCWKILIPHSELWETVGKVWCFRTMFAINKTH